MFTGIVQATGVVAAVTTTAAGRRLVVERTTWHPPAAQEPTHGASVSVSGVCLTVAAMDDATLSFDVIPETLDKTTVGRWSAGTRVNLEPAVTAAQPLGGHLVQGHVDGVGEVVGLDQRDQWRVTVRPPTSVAEALVAKGSVTVDGVSLTVASLDESAGTFDVALIPTTLELTTLGALCVGDAVNLEADVITRTVVTQLRRLGINAPAKAKPPVSAALLERAGFM
jgi:riboflavin synthase